MQCRKRGERLLALDALEWRQRRAEPLDQLARGIEIAVADRPARVAAVQVLFRRAERGKCMRESLRARAWTRAAQYSEFQRGNCMVVRARRRAKPEPSMLHQREQRDRFEATKRGP